jgi:hypothetical protein
MPGTNCQSSPTHSALNVNAFQPIRLVLENEAVSIIDLIDLLIVGIKDRSNDWANCFRTLVFKASKIWWDSTELRPDVSTDLSSDSIDTSPLNPHVLFSMT